MFNVIFSYHSGFTGIDFHNICTDAEWERITLNWMAQIEMKFIFYPLFAYKCHYYFLALFILPSRQMMGREMVGDRDKEKRMNKKPTNIRDELSSSNVQNYRKRRQRKQRTQKKTTLLEYQISNISLKQRFQSVFCFKHFWDLWKDKSLLLECNFADIYADRTHTHTFAA